MKLSLKESTLHAPSENCIVNEYKLSKKCDVAKIKITGRYPHFGKVKNNVCTLIYFCISGSGTITIEDEIFEISVDDQILIEPNKEYVVDGKNLVVLVSSSPAWYPEQYIHKEK
jgi:mannose-6-phosphate isomerase-like protein (cupin superfamily)